MSKSARRIAAAAAIGSALLLTGCSVVKPVPPADTQQPADPAPGDQGGTGSGQGTPQGTDLAGATFEMSWTDALDAAAEQFAGDPVSLALEWKRSGFAYTVELVNDTESFEVRFNADTGELVEQQAEKESASDIAEKRLGIIKPDELIDPAAAMAAAVAAEAGPVTEWEIDDENGQLTYEVQITTATGDADVRVDARSGEILKVDR